MILNKEKFYELGMKYNLKVKSYRKITREEYYWLSFPSPHDEDYFFIKYEDEIVSYSSYFEYNPYAHTVLGMLRDEEKFVTVERLEEIIQQSIKLYKEALVRIELEKMSDDFA